jgi:conserved oligomeric Golgi complex subunit 5
MTIIARLHRVDFGKSADAMGGMGGGASLYMKDLVDKLGFIKSEVLTKFNIDDDKKIWCVVGY